MKQRFLGICRGNPARVSQVRNGRAQANRRIMDSAAKRLKIPKDRCGGDFLWVSWAWGSPRIGWQVGFGEGDMFELFGSGAVFVFARDVESHGHDDVMTIIRFAVLPVAGLILSEILSSLWPLILLEHFVRSQHAERFQLHH